MCLKVNCAEGRKSSHVAMYMSRLMMEESCLKGRGALGVNGSEEEKLER